VVRPLHWAATVLPSRQRLRLSAIAVAVVAFAVSSRGSADQASTVEGTVVAVDQADLVLDVGGMRGATEGDVVELWRTVRLRHPTTGRTVVDRFRIGSLRLTQVQKTLSLARPEGEVARTPAVGDIVVLRPRPGAGSTTSAPPAPVKTPPSSTAGTGSGAAPPRPAPSTPAKDDVERPPPPAGTASDDPEAQKLAELFRSLAGTDPVTRIRRYEDEVRKSPRGRFAVVLWEEAQALRRTFEATGPAAAETNGPALLSFRAPTELRAGVPFTLALEAKRTEGAVLHVRCWSDASYTSIPMTARGPGYFAAEVPATIVRAPGVDYFIEGIDARGAAVRLVASAAAPEHTSVEDMPTATPRKMDTTAAFLADYAIYDAKRGNDRAFQTEGWIGTRFGDTGVRALRSGFGVYRGVGGSLRELDEEKRSPRKVGLTYGYLELEHGFSETMGVVGRVVVGLGDDGVAGGGQGFLRIGNDRRTNLLLGGEILGGVGVRGIAELSWSASARIPVTLRTEVTNQPAGASRAPEPTATTPAGTTGETTTSKPTSTEQGDLGARAIVQIGYRIVPSLVVAARGSYQGRTINHAGPGFGAAVMYEW
jgi:hypothetical protein